MDPIPTQPTWPWPGTWVYTAGDTSSNWMTVSAGSTTAFTGATNSLTLTWGTTWVAGGTGRWDTTVTPRVAANPTREERRSEYERQVQFFQRERERRAQEQANYQKLARARDFGTAPAFTEAERQMLVEKGELRITKPATRTRPARVYCVPAGAYSQVRIETPEGEWIETVCTQPAPTCDPINPQQHISMSDHDWVLFQKLLIEGAEAFYLLRGHHSHNMSYRGRRVSTRELPTGRRRPAA